MSRPSPTVAVLDYGMGNLRSVQKALEVSGAEARIVTEPSQIGAVDGLVLPGVGAFGDAIANLRRLQFDRLVLDAVERGTPLLGICVGLQVLFDEGTEMGQHRGLGIFPGRVVRFPPNLVVPHVGWNQLHVRRPHFLVDGLEDGAHAYFTHSYYPEPTDPGLVVATTDYGLEFASICAQENVCGVQFHPEKSWRVGLDMLRRYVRTLYR